VAGGFPDVIVINDRHVFRICRCSICERRGSLPAWANYEPDVECIHHSDAQTRYRWTNAA